VSVTVLTCPVSTTAVAAAAPEEKDIAGAVVYPEPAVVTVMATTAPPEMVATATAC
jgi:hypothetical protein